MEEEAAETAFFLQEEWRGLEGAPGGAQGQVWGLSESVIVNFLDCMSGWGCEERWLRMGTHTEITKFGDGLANVDVSVQSCADLPL